jgi:gentisate 1,2-dioxygenase
VATTRFRSPDADTDLLYKELAERDLQPLWELTGLLTAQPTTRAVPYVWHARELRPLAARAGELIPVERGGDRRVLACANPGLGGAPYAVGTLWAAVQQLNAGEVAPAHRHTPAALRFVLEGSGVWTVIDGDPVPMAAGDLVLTPSWTFHEHHNSGSQAMTWLDVLDLPVVAALDAIFYEDGPSDEVSLAAPEASHSEQRFGAGPGLLPAGAVGAAVGRSPLLAYRWADTDRALRGQLAAGARVGHVRYSDPLTGRDVMPTMRCEMLRVPASVTAGPARQAGGRIGCVLHGSGEAGAGTGRFTLGPGDVIAIPSWQPLSLTAERDLDIFFTSDAPVLDALGLYRESDG